VIDLGRELNLRQRGLRQPTLLASHKRDWTLQIISSQTEEPLPPTGILSGNFRLAI